VDVLFFIVKLHMDSRIDRAALNSLLHFLAKELLPVGNLLPPSLHLCKKVLGVESWRAKERHVCNSEKCVGHVFGHLDRKEWNHHKHEQCPNCHTSRFVEKKIGNKEVLFPRAWYLDLGLESAIKHMFEDTWFTSQRGKHRDPDVPGSYWASPECQRMAEAIKKHMGGDVDFLSEENSPYHLLLDWLEPYNSATYSVGVVAIR
jgi:hypothetical protein